MLDFVSERQLFSDEFGNIFSGAMHHVVDLKKISTQKTPKLQWFRGFLLPFFHTQIVNFL